MSIHRVLVNGRNFLIEFDGSVQKYGFYTTRFVEAENEETAGANAIELLRNDDTLKARVKNDVENPPVMFVEEIKRVKTDSPVNNTGFAWYVEDKIEL